MHKQIDGGEKCITYEEKCFINSVDEFKIMGEIVGIILNVVII